MNEEQKENMFYQIIGKMYFQLWSANQREELLNKQLSDLSKQNSILQSHLNRLQVNTVKESDG